VKPEQASRIIAIGFSVPPAVSRHQFESPDARRLRWFFGFAAENRLVSSGSARRL
jgi:hypothetical protein